MLSYINKGHPLVLLRICIRPTSAFSLFEQILHPGNKLGSVYIVRSRDVCCGGSVEVGAISMGLKLEPSLCLVQASIQERKDKRPSDVSSIGWVFGGDIESTTDVVGDLTDESSSSGNGIGDAMHGESGGLSVGRVVGVDTRLSRVS